MHVQQEGDNEETTILERMARDELSAVEDATRFAPFQQNSRRPDC